MSQPVSEERAPSQTLLCEIALTNFKLNFLLEPITSHAGGEMGLSLIKYSNQKVE